MSEQALIQFGIFLTILLLTVKPLGWYIAQVYDKKSLLIVRMLSPFEIFIYRIAGIKYKNGMSWKTYLSAILIFNLFGIVFVYIIQRLQFYLPLNPQHLKSIPPTLAFNSAISFGTNTNWQAYSGETTMSYFTNMIAFTVQNFISAATGIAILMAFIRSLRSNEGEHLGNFWVDIIRGILYLLIPLSILFAVLLNSQGVIQNFKPFQKITSISSHQKEQIIPMGPVASQVAIKELGTNGGGFFTTNSAHPFENPTPLSNFIEMLEILLIPAALCYTFGVMVKDTRQGWAILIVMLIIFIPLTFVTMLAEQKSNPAFHTIGIDQTYHKNLFPGGNMEGKETRFGIANSAIWATATTAASNGSTNAMLDSFTPIGLMIPFCMMHLGEVVFGGVGTGLYGMFLFIIFTVFIAGLMVGRTPEYLGKKIEPFEIKMASFAVLVIPLLVLIFTGIAVMTKSAVASITNPGAHGFSEIMYAFLSMGNNNGSALMGLNADTTFYNVMGGIAMFIGRYWIAIPTLAIAGSLVQKKIIPSSDGTLCTYTGIFVTLLVFVTIILGALSFLPALALGPIVEHLMFGSHYAH